VRVFIFMCARACACVRASLRVLRSASWFVCACSMREKENEEDGDVYIKVNLRLRVRILCVCVAINVHLVFLHTFLICVYLYCVHACVFVCCARACICACVHVILRVSVILCVCVRACFVRARVCASALRVCAGCSSQTASKESKDGNSLVTSHNPTHTMETISDSRLSTTTQTISKSPR